ncbi:MAG TPA: YggS family pyridoxal phosphate-dependent enzyme [Anaerolineales bacterium]|nr:YggS family pyridoxal phosphate-dependent enzyme [Anaerolineales bacterium]
MSKLDITAIVENYRTVCEKIEIASHATNLDPHFVKLVVVTKGHPLDSVLAVIEAGAQHLGENYAEEGVEKLLACSAYSHINWHMIGHIQSRKARLVSQYFDCVHSLDSYKLACRLDRFAGEQGRKLPVLLECNMSGETSKYGFTAWIESQWERLLPEIRSILALPNLNILGLMTMAPDSTDPEYSRPFYKKLRRLGEYFQKQLPQASWLEYSMGMSADYEIAIQEGATQVRVGTAIMGERAYT